MTRADGMTRIATRAMEIPMDELFLAPDPEHSVAAYWFWHRLPTDAEVREQISQMEEGGIRSFQIQARLSYPIEGYLEPEYLAMCRVAVEEAALRHMTVGIYDDYNWQSGQAGGRTVHGADHLRERHIFWSRSAPTRGGTVTTIVDGIESSAASLGPAGMDWQYDGATMSWCDWELLDVVGYPTSGVRSLDQVLDLTAPSQLIVLPTGSGCSVSTVVPDGTHDTVVVAFVGARCATSRVPNYLLKETAVRFLEVGYEPFFEAVGDHFGSTVKYFFFDQPHATFYDWAQRDGNLHSSVPYAEGLRQHIETSTGRPFAQVLLSLLDDVGDTTATVRLGFYDAYSALVLRNFLGTLADWCTDHHVALSGHEVLGHVGSWSPSRAFASWDLRVNFGLDYFGVDAYRGITGVDAQDCVPQLSTKMGDSVARSNGRSGCIVEQYMGRRATGWGLSLEDLRAQAFRLQILGARQFLYHGFYQTDGYDGDPSLFTNPRFDFPPGINFEPWWPFHREFADEAARLSVFLDGAPPVCDVAVLYPRRTAWMEGVENSYSAHVEFWSSYLASRGFGYHFVDERDLLKARFADGAMHLDARTYRSLVLPSVSSLDSAESIEALASFVEVGGTLVSSGKTPQHFQHGASGEAMRLWNERIAPSPNAHVLPDGLPVATVSDELLLPLLDRRPHAIVDSNAPIWQWAGHDEPGWRLVLFNDARTPRDVLLRTPMERAAVARWNATAGGIGPWHLLKAGAGGNAVIHLDAMELCCLQIREARTDEQLSAEPRLGIPASNDSSEGVDLRDGWTLAVPGMSPVTIDVSRGWEQQGLPQFSGAGKYVRTLELAGGENGTPATMPLGDLVLDLPVVHTAVEALINGQSIGRRAWSPYRFVVPRSELREGTNEIELVVYSAAGNRYYSDTPYQEAPDPSGLAADPVLRTADRVPPDRHAAG